MPCFYSGCFSRPPPLRLCFDLWVFPSELVRIWLLNLPLAPLRCFAFFWGPAAHFWFQCVFGFDLPFTAAWCNDKACSFLHQVVIPSSPSEAKGLLLGSIFDPNLVVFFGPKTDVSDPCLYSFRQVVDVISILKSETWTLQRRSRHITVKIFLWCCPRSWLLMLMFETGTSVENDDNHACAQYLLFSYWWQQTAKSEGARHCLTWE